MSSCGSASLPGTGGTGCGVSTEEREPRDDGIVERGREDSEDAKTRPDGRAEGCCRAELCALNAESPFLLGLAV